MGDCQNEDLRVQFDRRVCLMQDPLYRMDVVCAAMGYFQVPMTSYDVAAGNR